MRLIVIWFLVASCGREPAVTNQWDATLVPYLEEFVLAAAETGAEDCLARLGELRRAGFDASLTGPRTVGQCQRFTARNVYTGKTTRWAELSIADNLRDSPKLRFVVYHELVHCLCYRGHSTEGLMAPSYGEEERDAVQELLEALSDRESIPPLSLRPSDRR